jgi:hypothetical protein
MPLGPEAAVQQTAGLQGGQQPEEFSLSHVGHRRQVFVASMLVYPRAGTGQDRFCGSNDKPRTARQYGTERASSLAGDVNS